jgi:hypothetical protein
MLSVSNGVEYEETNRVDHDKPKRGREAGAGAKP